MAKPSPPKAVWDELKANPPKVLASTRRKFGAKQANRQRVAIAFSKSGLSRGGK